MAENSDGTPEKKKTISRRRRWFVWGGVVMAAIILGIGGYFYDVYAEHHPGTDDAYIKASVVHIAPQLSGKVSELHVADQRHVDKGDLLLRIDPAPYEAAVRSAEARLAMARQTVAANMAAVAAAKAALADKRAALQNAETHLRRAKALARTQATPRAQLDDARSARNQARADVHLAAAKFARAKQQLGTPGDTNFRIRMAKAALTKARINLEHTHLTAPCSGRISGAAELHRGDFLSAGRPSFSLVCDGSRWVYANFEETDLMRIRPGQKATISVDMYPDHKFYGIVESIDPASGTAFSLLPPENATGNWVKVTQRVPVRILVIDTNPAYPLSVQTSTEVTIDTGSSNKPTGRPRDSELSDAAAMAQARRLGIEGAAELASNRKRSR